MTTGRQDGHTAHDRWDAGDMGCGELIILLRSRVRALRPGQLLELISRDPASPEDLASWCRMTGHSLVLADHPTYLIRRKDD